MELKTELLYMLCSNKKGSSQCLLDSLSCFLVTGVIIKMMHCVTLVLIIISSVWT